MSYSEFFRVQVMEITLYSIAFLMRIFFSLTGASVGSCVQTGFPSI